jgi:hypothetical protein
LNGGTACNPQFATAFRNDTATDDLGDLLASWRRHMTAQRISPAMLSTYSTSVGQPASFLAAQGMPTSPASATIETSARCAASTWDYMSVHPA